MHPLTLTLMSFTNTPHSLPYSYITYIYTTHTYMNFLLNNLQWLKT